MMSEDAVAKSALVTPAFPFTALVGQDALRLALLLAAIDPGIGGVLISGPRGTAKSTSARALAALLPEPIFVDLPLGASEAQLTGTIDLEAVLREGAVKFLHGLLAKAHQGVLYVDEVNLLSDHLVDPLLDVASSGVNIVEREGVSHRHASRFVLVGTMNPEEGELRPQLSDRFGLSVHLENCTDSTVRQQIVRTRLAFDADPVGFCEKHHDAQQALKETLARARQLLPALSFDDAVHAYVSRLCIAAGVDGVRADLVMLKAARALAAFEAAEVVTSTHVGRVAELVFAHRCAKRSWEDTREPRPADEPSADGAASSRPDGSALDDGEARGGEAGREGEGGSDVGGGRNGGGGGGGSGGDRDREENESQGEGDWGFEPPVPVGTTSLKRLRPFPPKKV